MRLTPILLLALWGCELDPLTLDDGGADQGATDGAPRADGSDRTDAFETADAGFEGDAADPAADGSVEDARPGPDADAPEADAGPPADMGGDPPDAFVEYPPRYTDDRLLSPITPLVAARLRVVAAINDAQDDVFAKVGASSTVSRSFMHCFAGGGVNLDGRDSLRETIDFFGAGDAAGGSPYTRESVSAVVGWSASSAIAGDPSPLDRELAALNPRFAVIMYGTNDIQRRNLDQYANNLFDMADLLVARGVIPIFSSVMPRDDDAEADALVPSYNAVVRGVAQSRQVPFTDLHQPLLSLPNHGLGGDRLHSSAFPGGACVFTDAGMMHGYNWRNLLTIETLDRLMHTVLDGEPAPDPPNATPLDSLTTAPTVIPSLPYTAVRNTALTGAAELDSYPGCDAAQDESGREHVFRITVDAPTSVRAWVLDRGDADVDLHLLRNPADPNTCVQRDNREIRATLDPGTWYFVLDTYVSAGQPRAGEYLFVLVRD